MAASNADQAHALLGTGFTITVRLMGRFVPLSSLIWTISLKLILSMVKRNAYFSFGFVVS